MRLNAIRRPPASQIDTLTLMFISCALVMPAWMMRLASASVRAMSLPPVCVKRLFRGGPAIDDELAPRHERRLVRGQKQHAIGDVLRRADTPHREATHALLELSLVLQHVLDHIGRDRSGVHRIAADPFLRVLDRRRLGEEPY